METISWLTMLTKLTMLSKVVHFLFALYARGEPKKAGL